MTSMFSAHLQYVMGDVTAEYLADVVEDLHGMHPAVGTAEGGRVTVQITFPAEDQRSAYMTALDRVTAAVNRIWRRSSGVGSGTIPEYINVEPVYLELMPEEEFNRREGWDNVPELVGVPEAAEILGLSRQRVLQLIEGDRFASMRRVGERTIVLSRSEVEKYRDALRASPIAPAVESDRREGEWNEGWAQRITGQASREN